MFLDPCRLRQDSYFTSRDQYVYGLCEYREKAHAVLLVGILCDAQCKRLSHKPRILIISSLQSLYVAYLPIRSD